MDPSTYIIKIQAIFEKAAKPENAAAMAAYMKNKFAFYGIKSEERKALSREWMHELPQDKSALLVLCDELWDMEEREWQYLAMDVMEKRKLFRVDEALGYFEKWTGKKSWWDTVDFLATNMLGGYLKSRPDLATKKVDEYLASNHLWFQRSAILFQLKYKQSTDTQLLEKAILALHESDEFFIQKAAGWALREYGKYNPDWVSRFVNAYSLKPLTRREAMRIINLPAPK